MHRDISPLLRHATSPPSLHLPSNSWFYHSSADRHGLGQNNYLTENHSPFNFGLPLFKTSPPTSNLYMVFNGRLSAPQAIAKQTKDKNKKFLVTPGVHNTQSLLNYLSDERWHHTKKNDGVKSNFVQNTLLLQSIPSQDKDTGSESEVLNHNMAAVTPAEAQNNTDPVIRRKTTAQVLPEMITNVSENTHDSASLTVPKLHDEEEYVKLLHKGLESLKESGRNEVNASEVKKPTTIVLKPVAKAVAGPKGIALAAPQSRAVVRKGQDVNIHFDPEAVAVVGPGGVADAHSDLFISYYEDLFQKKEKR
jgi:hypothetical protein